MSAYVLRSTLHIEVYSSPSFTLSTEHSIVNGQWLNQPNSMTIPCHLCRFHLSSMLCDTDFGQVIEFPWHWLRKEWDFWAPLTSSRRFPVLHDRHYLLDDRPRHPNIPNLNRINDFLPEFLFILGFGLLPYFILLPIHDHRDLLNPSCFRCGHI